MIKGKRGDLTAGQIIVIVLSILGFVVVLAAIYLIDFGGQTEEDLCKLSVLTRATAPGIAQSEIPLKCRTKKICITDKFFAGDSCSDQFAGEKDIEYVQLSGDPTNKRRQIEETSANAMYDCWSMMGEGKLDLFGSLKQNIGLDYTNSKCVVCSRVAIDKGVEQNILYERDSEGKLVPAIKINDYMRTHQVPGSSLTYLQTFTDRGVSSFAKVEEQDVNKLQPSGLVPSSTSSNNDLAFVFMQVKSEKVGDVLANLGTVGVVAAGSVFFSPAGGLVGKIVGFAGAKVAVIGTIAAGVVIGGIATYNALEGQNIAAMHCEEYAGVSKGYAGCSTVQGVSYRFDVINKLCGSIEGEL